MIIRFIALLSVFAALFVLYPEAGLAQLVQSEPRLSVRQEGNIIIVSGWLQPDVTPAEAWRVLTDYERFPAFVPGIRANRITTDLGARKVIEQQGEVTAGSLKIPYGGTMLISETPEREMRIVFLNGLFKDVQGTWQLGRKRPVRLSYEMRMDLMKSPYPPTLANQIAEQQVRNWVAVFAAEMERRQSPNGTKQ